KFGVGKIRPEFPEFVEIKYIVVDNSYIHMQRYCPVSVFQPVRHKCICTLARFIQYTVYEIAPPLDHPLVDEFFERLFFRNVTQVFEKFIPEATVQQMSGCVLRTTD